MKGSDQGSEAPRLVCATDPVEVAAGLLADAVGELDGARRGSRFPGARRWQRWDRRGDGWGRPGTAPGGDLGLPAHGLPGLTVVTDLDLGRAT